MNYFYVIILSIGFYLHDLAYLYNLILGYTLDFE